MTKILRIPEDEGGGGGEEEQQQNNTALLSGESDEGQQEQQSEEKETEEPKPTSLTREDLASILQTVVPAAIKEGRATEPPAKQMTQEELDTFLNVYKPSAQIIKDLRSEDENVALAAIQQVVQGVVKQAATMSDVRLQQVTQDMRTKDLAPLQSFYEEQRAQNLEREFYGKHKDLEPYKEIVDIVSAKLVANGLTGDKNKIFDETAKATKAVVEKMTGKGMKPNGQNGTRQRSMSTLTGGGQGGNGAGQGTRSSGLPAMHIFKNNDD